MTVDPTDLPDDLADLERALRSRARVEPCAALRGRVLAEVHARLATASRRLALVRFAAALVAGAMVWVNLSMSIANHAAAGVTHPDGQAARALARRLRDLAPDLTQHEALRQAVLLHAGSRLAATPWLSPAIPLGRPRPEEEITP